MMKIASDNGLLLNLLVNIGCIIENCDSPLQSCCFQSSRKILAGASSSLRVKHDA